MKRLPACPAKSTMMSERSEGAMKRWLCPSSMFVGAFRRPPSDPICQIEGPGVPMPAGSVNTVASPLKIPFVCASCDSCICKKRAFDALSTRKRYRRGCTSRKGHDLPFTVMTSPKYSGTANGCRFGLPGGPLNPLNPFGLFAPDPSGKRSWPFVSKLRSAIRSSCSKAPPGSVIGLVVLPVSRVSRMR